MRTKNAAPSLQAEEAVADWYGDAERLREAADECVATARAIRGQAVAAMDQEIAEIERDLTWAAIATLRAALAGSHAMLAAVVTALGGEYAFSRRVLYDLDTERTEIVTWESPDSLMQHVAVRLSAAPDAKEG